MHGKSKTGKDISMEYAVADIGVALDSVSQICDTGTTVTFEKSGGVIRQGNGNEERFDRVGDTYVRTVVVDREPTFRRPGAISP